MLSTKLSLIDVEQAIAQVEELWQIGRTDRVADYSPNQAPVIKQPEQLRKHTSVDDSPLVCYIMEKLLVAAGYRYIGITDGMRAIATLLARKPNLIFLDLVMPYTNGYEICTQLRKVACFRDIPIVILTSNDGLVDQVRARLVGASDFLSKPIDASVVQNVLRQHLQQGAATR